MQHKPRALRKEGKMCVCVCSKKHELEVEVILGYGDTMLLLYYKFVFIGSQPGHSRRVILEPAMVWR